MSLLGRWVQVSDSLRELTPAVREAILAFPVSGTTPPGHHAPDILKFLRKNEHALALLRQQAVAAVDKWDSGEAQLDSGQRFLGHMMLAGLLRPLRDSAHPPPSSLPSALVPWAAGDRHRRRALVVDDDVDDVDDHGVAVQETAGGGSRAGR